MCFSPEASFAVGAALVPTAAYCARAAWAKDPRLLPVALIPLAFAAQQAAEGVVWLGLHAGDPAQTRAGALVFLFFALAFWPFWPAVAAAVLEPCLPRRRLFVALAAVNTAWFWVLYFPLLVWPELLTIQVVHHSVQYNYPDLAVYQYVPRPALRLLYLLAAVVPVVFGPNVIGRLPGAMLVGSVVVAAALFSYAFISVWCFFAAALALHLCVLFYRLPARGPAAQPAEPGPSAE